MASAVWSDFFRLAAGLWIYDEDRGCGVVFRGGMREFSEQSQFGGKSCGVLGLEGVFGAGCAGRWGWIGLSGFSVAARVSNLVVDCFKPMII